MEENASLKKELEQKLLAMLNPLKARFSEEKAGLPLGGFAAGYGMKIAEMEGALRLLWGLTPYWAGGGTQAEDWKDHYLNCIRHGTAPDHPAYWGDIHDRDQKIVEMAALSFQLMETPDIIWNRMTAKEQDHLASWLYQANTAIVPDNNWHFFVVLVNLALKKLGKPYSIATNRFIWITAGTEMANDLKKITTCLSEFIFIACSMYILWNRKIPNAARNIRTGQSNF